METVFAEADRLTSRDGVSLQDFLVLRRLLTAILEEHLKGPVPEPRELLDHPQELTAADLRWLTILDLCAAPDVLRRGLQECAPDEASLIVLMRYFLHLGQPVDVDRFDWVLTYTFRRRSELGEGLGNMGAQIMEMFPDFPQPPLSNNARDLMDKIAVALVQIRSFTTFAELSVSGLIAKGREYKEQLQDERHHPAVLAAVVNYNLILGEAFRRLFNRAALDSRELANRLAHADYRGNVAHMMKLKESSEPEEVIRESLHDPVKDLGLDELRESQKLKAALQLLVSHCEKPENRGQKVLSLSNLRLHVTEWEMRALSTAYPAGDLSFRAELARSLGNIVVFHYRIQEERDQYHRKSSTEYLWKPHYDALIWLYARGKEYVQTMNGMVLDVAKRGLLEKQQQLEKSVARLADSLNHLAVFLTEPR